METSEAVLVQNAREIVRRAVRSTPYQHGSVRLERHKTTGKPLFWLGRWREDVLQPDDTLKRVLRSRKLADYGDRYRTKTDVQPLLDDILRPLNAGRCDAKGTMSVKRYIEQVYLPWTKENLKPSTHIGYAKLFGNYLSPRVGEVSMRDFRTVDAARLLAELQRSRNLNKTTLQHIKAFLSGIFRFAKSQGAIDGLNPVQDAMLPKQAKPATETHAHSLEETLTILNCLPLQGKAAVALMAFAGLRPGEARGLEWEDYNGEQLRISRSRWRTYTTSPKTEDSAKAVPVIEPLRCILDELRQANGKPTSGPILRGPRHGRPLDLDNFANRVVIPALQRCAVCQKSKAEHKDNGHAFELDKTVPQWRGWYAFRRGIATELVAVTKDPMAAKGLLRHGDVRTTQRFYIKDVPAVTLAGMRQIEQLCSQSVATTSGKPN